MEDLTDPEKIRMDPKCDRTVSLYGYLRGAHLKNKGQVHIPGTRSGALAVLVPDWTVLNGPAPVNHAVLLLASPEQLTRISNMFPL